MVNPGAVPISRPWEIDLTQLLDFLLHLLTKAGRLDLRVCGTAALSSAIIYRLKVETLFLFEKLRLERRASALGEPPQVILMPFRYELSSTSIEDLVAALERILEEVLRQQAAARERPRRLLVEPEPIIEMDPFVTHIHEMLDSFKTELLKLLAKSERVSFREMVAGRPLLEEVRSFILLLFVAMEGLVRLEQPNGDIIIVNPPVVTQR